MRGVGRREKEGSPEKKGGEVAGQGYAAILRAGRREREKEKIREEACGWAGVMCGTSRHRLPSFRVRRIGGTSSSG